ncbi:MAG: gliding motility-associated C-terminal domain-containing protein, partial [Bacteroidales bacterium]|nr:gliding motility-associated C-terminal domain-containing protein [Bacteroidales bacterium]
NVTTNVTTIYTVSGTDGNGCINSTPVTLTINTLPILTATGGTICIGNSIMVTVTGANAYTWSTGPFTTSILVNPIINTQYCVTGIDLNGCKNSTCTSVVVNAKPIVTATGNPHFICNGESATITATGGNTYTWFPGGSNGNTIVVTPNATITYTVTGTDGNNCTNLDTAVIIVNPPISAGITGIDETCGNKAGKVCASPNGGTPGYAYVWNVAGDSLCLDSLHAGTFTVTVTDSKGCTTIRTVSITNQIINPSGIATADKYFDVITHTFLLDWNGDYGFKYDWDFGDTTAHSNLKNPIHTYKYKGTYTVKLIVTSPDGCTSEYTFIIEVVIPTKLEVFNVFTPNSDGLNDKYRVKYEGDFLYFRMIIFNRWGNKLFETNDIDKGWDGKQWTKDGMSDGTYYYIISAKGKDMVEYEFHGYLTLIK